MSKSFLITSHTEGSYPFEQSTILHGLVQSLRRYFPDCFIILASQSDVEADTQKLVNYVIIDKVTANVPYGQGELELVSAGLRAMKQFGRKDCFKIVYDFIIDDSNYQVFDQWLDHQKDFVGCYWRSAGLGIGSWVWYGTVEMQEQLLEFDQLNMHLECKILETLENKNLLEKCYIYESHDAMFQGNWFNKCDLVHAGGKVLKFNYGTVIAVLEITDDAEFRIPGIVQSLATQEKRPNHLLFVDSRTNKTDLRLNQMYWPLFDLLGKNQIYWSLIYFTNYPHILSYLAETNHTWCWLVNNSSLSESDTLKNLYRQIILNFDIGTISLKNGDLFYRNRIINFDGLNTDTRNFIVDRMQETCYTNVNY